MTYTLCTTIVCVTIVILYGLRIISKVITHFIEKDEDFGK